jgi:hypothetical protein
MSAIGPKRTLLFAPHMSAFGGKADMAFAESVFAVAIGVSRHDVLRAHVCF